MIGILSSKIFDCLQGSKRHTRKKCVGFIDQKENTEESKEIITYVKTGEEDIREINRQPTGIGGNRDS